MTINTIPQVAVIGTRPTRTPDGETIPASWPIYNAPRPLYGKPNWQHPEAPFRSFGWWFAAIDPNAPDKYDAECNTRFVEENRRLDARELIFVSDEEAFLAGVQAQRTRYGSDAKIMAKIDAWVADPAHRDYFIDKGIEEMAIQAG